jgi:hypothetical protein
MSCKDQSTPGHPLLVLGEALSNFLNKFPIATASMIMQHLSQSNHIIKDIIQRELRLQKFSRRWVPHSIFDSQNADYINKANKIFAVLQERAS